MITSMDKVNFGCLIVLSDICIRDYMYLGGKKEKRKWRHEYSCLHVVL